MVQRRLSVGEAADRPGVSLHTLRWYDEIGGKTMSKPKITQVDLEAARKQYAQEAKERWGDTDVWKESQTKQPQTGFMADAAEIFAGFAALVGTDPADASVQAQVARWQQHITDNYYTCTKQILAGLGQMYVCDARFTANLDQYGPGTAQLMSDAIAIYCGK